MMNGESQITYSDNIRNCAEILTKDAYTLAMSHFYRANWWGRLHYIFGGAAIIASVSAGTSLLIGDPFREIFAGILSLISSILISLVTFLKPHKEEQDHYRAGSRFLSLYYTARVFCEVEPERNAEEKNQLSELQKLIKQMEEIDKISPRIPEITWTKALKSCNEYFDNWPIKHIT